MGVLVISCSFSENMSELHFLCSQGVADLGRANAVDLQGAQQLASLGHVHLVLGAGA